MTEVNEELVRRYFELQGYFVRMNVPYSYRTPKGMGWSDVDLCISHPKSRDAAAVEVKGWHTESISPGHIRNWPSLFNFVRTEALDAVGDLFGHSEFRRVLVVSRLGERGREEVMQVAIEREVEILEFPEILKFLIANIPSNRDAGSESEHVIRLLNVYGFLNSQPSATVVPSHPVVGVHKSLL